MGIGRPFLYAFSTYGVDGVDHALQILQVSCLAKYFGRFHFTTPDLRIFLQDEFEMSLRLLGALTIKDIVPAMVDATNIHSHLVAVPHDQLYNANCTRLSYPPVRGLTVS